MHGNASVATRCRSDGQGNKFTHFGVEMSRLRARAPGGHIASQGIRAEFAEFAYLSQQELTVFSPVEQYLFSLCDERYDLTYESSAGADCNKIPTDCRGS